MIDVRACVLVSVLWGACAPGGSTSGAPDDSGPWDGQFTWEGDASDLVVTDVGVDPEDDTLHKWAVQCDAMVELQDTSMVPANCIAGPLTYGEPEEHFEFMRAPKLSPNRTYAWHAGRWILHEDGSDATFEFFATGRFQPVE